MSLTITFTKDAESVTLPAPLPGAPVSTARIQASGVAADGGEYIYDCGIARYGKTEKFEDLSALEKGELEIFFHARKGRQESFTYTDSGGNEYAASFAEPSLTFTKISPERWSLTLPLVLDAMGA
ncbi:MAG: hypothetical protein JXR97_08090 [Planctomycetes bacterium]|nr:hypothetical protein [Planctomycetota bacterium]